jgi:4-methyl-5(b-hydroxyethyl)-thiazole monophosphate biosynthesis
MIILPGGMPGTLNLEKNTVVQSAIDFCMKNNKYIGAICAAPSIFGHKGFLKGRKACSYPSFESHLEGAEVTAGPVAIDGHIITSRGMGTSIPFALASAG